MSQTRIYRVKNIATGQTRLIRGITKASVRGFAARDLFDIAVASQDDLVQAITAGTKVEDVAAGADDGDAAVAG